MKKQFGKLSKTEQEQVESAYHRMKPEDFDEQMSRAKTHTPASFRLPARLVKRLQKVAKSSGETEYQAMVRKWIEERLKQEISAAG